MSSLTKSLPWTLPLILIILLAPISPYLDMNIEKYYFNEDGFQSNQFQDFMFDFGIIPAWIVFGFSLIIVLLSFISDRYKRLRPYALLPVLTMIIGSGLIVHATFKDNWGRPRPKQVIQFGGGQEFRPFYKPNIFDQPEPSKSFPCGHCSLGFYFFSLAFVGIRLRNGFIAWGGFFLAMLLGITLGVVRMSQGGHFFSDVVVGASIMWWTALGIDYMLFTRKTTDEQSH